MAASQAKEVAYKVAKPNVAATAVPGEVAVDKDVGTVGVTDKDLAAARERCATPCRAALAGQWAPRHPARARLCRLAARRP